MIIGNEIIIQEKPDWVSWDDIKQCLTKAHSENRAKGVNMTHYQWPAEKIKASLGDRGVMLVALDGDILVGTAAFCEKQGNKWYNIGRYAHLGYAGVLPEYRGYGIYKLLINRREETAKEFGFSVIVFDTHSRNTRVQEIAKKNGYRYVRFFRAQSGDHFNVTMAKWLGGKKFSDYHINKCYCLSWLLSRLKYNERGEERSHITTAIYRRLNNRLKVL